MAIGRESTCEIFWGCNILSISKMHPVYLELHMISSDLLMELSKFLFNGLEVPIK